MPGLQSLGAAWQRPTACTTVGIIIREPHPVFDKVKGGLSQTNHDPSQNKPIWDLQLGSEPGNKVFGWTLFPNEVGLNLLDLS